MQLRFEGFFQRIKISMIISRAPLRISFVGGGTDISYFYQRHKGAVVSCSINKYVYIEKHPYFWKNRIQVKYSQTENVGAIEDLKHDTFRAVAKRYQLLGHELSCTSDIPAGTGMGSSSAFTVALLNAVHSSQSRFKSKTQLAHEACEIEIEELGAPIGKQDQYASALGGLNFIEFIPNHEVVTTPINLSKENQSTLESNLALFFTGISRSANELLAQQRQVVVGDISKFNNLKLMSGLANELNTELRSGNIGALGTLLNDNWRLKMSLNAGIAGSNINTLYEAGLEAGADGGKLLGAGGGGFLLFYCPLAKKHELIARMEQLGLKHLPFCIEYSGTQIIHAS